MMMMFVIEGWLGWHEANQRELWSICGDIINIEDLVLEKRFCIREILKSNCPKVGYCAQALGKPIIDYLHNSNQLAAVFLILLLIKHYTHTETAYMYLEYIGNFISV